MKTTLLLVLLISIISVSAQQPEADKILKEGQLLYRLEKASWYGTDFLMNNFPKMRDSVGGYLSYGTNKNHIINIFFDKSTHHKVLITSEFDSLPKHDPLSFNPQTRAATKLELELIAIRQDVVEKMTRNEDNFFTFYDKTSINPIPLITANEKKVFLITGPQGDGLVLIGNDYLFKYDKDNKLVSKEKLHNSLIQLAYKSNDSKNPTTATIHSHVVSELITSTDICTLLLYKEFVEWKTHYVVSKHFVSIFDMQKELLVIMTTEAWKKMSEATKEKK
jgi:hypothetical protein